MPRLFLSTVFALLVAAAGCSKAPPASTTGASGPASSVADILVVVPSGAKIGGLVPSAAVLDPAALPHLATGSPVAAAGEFGPAGLSCPEGLAVTWKLATARPKNSRLWVQVLNRATGEWSPTGETAVVLESGRQAVGRVFHFSTIGVSDDTGIVTEWVWLFWVYEESLEGLARTTTEKYREALRIPAGFGLGVKELLDTGGTVAFEKVRDPVTGISMSEPVKIENVTCLEAAREEFRSRKQRLDVAFAEAMAHWVDAVARGDAAAVTALWEAHLDLERVAKERQGVFRNFWMNTAWDLVKEYAYKRIRDGATQVVDKWVGLSAFTRNPLLKLPRDKAIELAAKKSFKVRLDQWIGRPGPEEMLAFSADLVTMADSLLMSLAYNRNHGREGTFLNAEPNVRYELRLQSVAAMANSGEFTAGVQQKASKLAAKSHATVEEFQAALHATLTPEEFDVSAPALVDLARTVDDPVITDAYYALGGPETESLGGKPKAGLQGAFHLAFSLALFQPYLLPRKVAPMIWEYRGDPLRLDAGWVDVFEGKAAREHEFRWQSDGIDKTGTARTGPPGDGDGNFPDLRLDYLRYRATIRAEGERGSAAFDAAIAGANGTTEQRVQALAAIRLLSSDIRKFIAQDFDRTIKQSGINIVAAMIAAMPASKRVLGNWASIILKERVKSILNVTVDTLIPDALVKFEKDVDLASARLAHELGVRPEIERVFAHGAAELATTLALDPHLPAACEKQDPNDLRLEIAWRSPPRSTELVIRAVGAPQELDALTKACDRYQSATQGKWVLLTFTTADKKFYRWECLQRVGWADHLADLDGRIELFPGHPKVTVSLTMLGQKLSATAEFEPPPDPTEGLKGQLATQQKYLKDALAGIEQAKSKTLVRIKEIETDKAGYEERANAPDTTAEQRAVLKSYIPDCDKELAIHKNRLRCLACEPVESEWASAAKKPVASAYQSVSGLDIALGRIAEAKAAIEEARRWGLPEGDWANTRSSIAFTELDWSTYEETIRKSTAEPDYYNMTRLALLRQNDLAAARRFSANLSEKQREAGKYGLYLPPIGAVVVE